jgi:hypothetical protein
MAGAHHILIKAYINLPPPFRGGQLVLQVLPERMRRMRLDTMTKRQNDEPTVAESGEVSELAEWFNVSGDMDDFIYFGENPTCSER